MPTLVIEVESKTFSGLYVLQTRIDNKPYIFNIASEYIIRQVKWLIKKKYNGKAINLLKKWNIYDAVVTVCY